jgi:hypothetical protein
VLSEHTSPSMMWFKDEPSGSFFFFFYETNQVEVGGHVMPETDEDRGVIVSDKT